MGGKESDYKAVIAGLDELAADYPPLEDDTKETDQATTQTTDTRGADRDPRNL
jgi:hypothetical protein